MDHEDDAAEGGDATAAGAHESIETRLSQVERRINSDERSASKKISVYGALVALLISILTGSFTLYDNLFLRPSKQLDEAKSEIREVVGRITQLNWRLAELDLAGDDQKTYVISRIANGEKLSLLGRADVLIEQNPDIASVSELMVLAAEHLNFGNSREALRYANLAEHSAPPGLLRAEALRYRARALAAPGSQQDLTLGRSVFRRAIEEAGGIQSPLSASVLVNAYGDWIYFELLSGLCDAANDLQTKLLESLRQRQVSEPEYRATRDNLSLMFSRQTRCRQLPPIRQTGPG